MKTRFNKHGLTEKQDNILRFLVEFLSANEMPPRNAEIAAACVVHEGNISATLYSLECRDLISRQRNGSGNFVVAAKHPDMRAIDIGGVVFDAEFDCWRDQRDAEEMQASRMSDFERKCLSCGGVFSSHNRYQFMCPPCGKSAGADTAGADMGYVGNMEGILSGRVGGYFKRTH